MVIELWSTLYTYSQKVASQHSMGGGQREQMARPCKNRRFKSLALAGSQVEQSPWLYNETKSALPEHEEINKLDYENQVLLQYAVLDSADA